MASRDLSDATAPTWWHLKIFPSRHRASSCFRGRTYADGSQSHSFLFRKLCQDISGMGASCLLPRPERLVGYCSMHFTTPLVSLVRPTVTQLAWSAFVVVSQRPWSFTGGSSFLGATTPCTCFFLTWAPTAQHGAPACHLSGHHAMAARPWAANPRGHLCFHCARASLRDMADRALQTSVTETPGPRDSACVNAAAAVR